MWCSVVWHFNHFTILLHFVFLYWIALFDLSLCWFFSPIFIYSFIVCLVCRFVDFVVFVVFFLFTLLFTVKCISTIKQKQLPFTLRMRSMNEKMILFPNFSWTWNHLVVVCMRVTCRYWLFLFKRKNTHKWHDRCICLWIILALTRYCICQVEFYKCER